MGTKDPAKALQRLTEAFNFERDLLDICRTRKMSRVVTAVAEGRVDIPEADGPSVVQYLIFELADGDIRSQVDVTKRYELRWALRALHHVATGMFQLHSQRIAHQDVKPSNVLVFEKRMSKLADLGRAYCEGKEPPHEEFNIAGDPSYAPPELLYNYVPEDRTTRRFGCDAYLLGSLVYFFFTGMMLTPLLIENLRRPHRPDQWAGPYADVLPFLRESFQICIEFLRGELSESISSEICLAVQQLCDPDPSIRGHPRARLTRESPFSLQRYISLFDRLAARAEAGLL